MKKLGFWLLASPTHTSPNTNFVWFPCQFMWNWKHKGGEMHCERKGNCLQCWTEEPCYLYSLYSADINIVVIFLDNTIDSTFCLFNNIIANIGYWGNTRNHEQKQNPSKTLRNLPASQAHNNVSEQIKSAVYNF